MTVITGRILGASTGGTAAVAMPAVVVEDVAALRALTGSVDVPAAIMRVRNAATGVGGGTFLWDDTPATDDDGRRFNAGGYGSSGVGWQRVDDGTTPTAEWWIDGTGDDTVQLQRALTALGANSVLRLPGAYTITGTITISQARVRLVGDGKHVSSITFNPASPGLPCFHFTAGAGVLYQCGISGLGFVSANTTDQKIAIRATDTSEFTAEDIAVLNWTGNTSVGIQLRGREATTVRRVSVQADRPISIEENPNSASISCDHLHLEDIYLLTLAATGAGIYFDDANVNVTNLTMGGTNPIIGGKYGVYWPAAGGSGAQHSLAVQFKNIRYEQTADASGYAIRYEHLTTSLTIDNVLSGGNKGFYIRATRGVSIRDCLHPNVNEALNIDGCYSLVAGNWFRETGSTSNYGAMVKQFALAPYPTADSPYLEVWTTPLANNVAYLNGTAHWEGAGSPEGVVTGSVGDTYHRTDGAAGTTLYVKESGAATNTGWVAVTSSSDYGTADQVMQTNAGGTAREWGKIANANVDASAAIAVSKLAIGNADEVLKTNTLGTGVEYGKIANANIDAAAAIGTAKLALSPATAQQYSYSSATGVISYLPGAEGKVAGWDQDGNVAAIYTYKSVVFLAAGPGSALSLGAHPNSEQDLANSDDMRRNGIYLDDCTQYRLHACVVTASASANTPVLYVQYSDDDSAWNDGDAGPATISLSTVGRYSTSWTNMATTFKTDDIYVRIAQNGGDGVATPAILYAWVEFR